MSIFKEDFSLNLEQTKKHAENLIDKGCHGVVILGSTGQAQLISVKEKMELIEHLSNSSQKNNFIIGTGNNSLTETINMMKHSKENAQNSVFILVHSIKTNLTAKGYKSSGGKLVVKNPWALDDNDLDPYTYEYFVRDKWKNF